MIVQYCSHQIQQEKRTKPERFLDTDRDYSLEEVLDMPLNLSRMPFEVNSLSPTPLDPYNVKVHGVDYEAAALEYMLASLFIAAGSVHESHPAQFADAEGEVEYQHRHRMQKNDEAMERWREAAASGSGNTKLTHAEAEGVLQVRAGMSRIGAAVKLLARNPEMEAIEISKATRPFCNVSYHLAKKALMGSIESFAQNGSIDMIMTDRAGSAPYRHIMDERHKALIIKSKLARASIDGVDLELVGRESGIMYNPLTTPPLPEADHKKLNGMDVAILPLDMTSYVRVTNQ